MRTVVVVAVAEKSKCIILQRNKSGKEIDVVVVKDKKSVIRFVVHFHYAVEAA